MMVSSRLTGGPSQHQACLKQQAALRHNGVPSQHGTGAPEAAHSSKPYCLSCPQAAGSQGVQPTGYRWWADFLGSARSSLWSWALFLQLEPDLGCMELPTTSGLLLPPPMLWGGAEEGTGSGGLHPQPYFFFKKYLSLSWLHWVLVCGVQDLHFLMQDFFVGGTDSPVVVGGLQSAQAQ